MMFSYALVAGESGYSSRNDKPWSQDLPIFVHNRDGISLKVSHSTHHTVCSSTQPSHYKHMNRKKRDLTDTRIKRNTTQEPHISILRHLLSSSRSRRKDHTLALTAWTNETRHIL